MTTSFGYCVCHFPAALSVISAVGIQPLLVALHCVPPSTMQRCAYSHHFLSALDAKSEDKCTYFALVFFQF